MKMGFFVILPRPDTETVNQRGYPWDWMRMYLLVSVHWFAAYKWCIAILTQTLCPQPHGLCWKVEGELIASTY